LETINHASHLLCATLARIYYLSITYHH